MKPTALYTWVITLCFAVSMMLSACTEPGGSQLLSPTPGASPSTGTDAPEPQTASPREGGELVIGAVERLPAFDPFGFTKREAILTPYESLAYRGLLAYTPDGRLTGALAESYQIDRSGPKPVVVLTLRKDAKWADGQPVTVEDVTFTLETYALPDYYGVWKKPLNDVQGVSRYRSGKSPSIPGVTADAAKGEVRIAVEQDDHAFLDGLTAPLLPRHQLAGKPPAEIDQLSRAGKILGAGPFQPQSMTEAEWTFAANASFYEGKPHLAAIRVVQVKPEALASEAASGRVHLLPLPPDRAQAVAADAKQAGAVVPAAARGFHFVGFNLESPALKDAAVRRALAQAVPRETIAEEVFHGWAELANSPLAPGSFAYVAGEYPAFDREAAALALSAKGYTPEKPLSLTLVYPDDSAVRKQLAESLAAAWEGLAVKLEQKALPPDDFIAHLFGGNPADLYLFAWTYPADPAGLREVWHSRERVGETGLNASRYHNPRADQLLDQARAMLPDDQRKPLLAEWQRLFAADLPILPLAELRQPHFVSAKLKGAGESLGSIQPFVHVHTWWLDE